MRPVRRETPLIMPQVKLLSYHLSPTSPEGCCALQEMMTSDRDNENLLGSLLAGRYEIFCLLEDGSKGAVYKARLAGDGCLVAIKVWHEKLLASDPTFKRFEEKARLAAELSQENLVSVKDFGLTDSGCPFLVTDFQPGLSLAELIAQLTEVPADRALRVFFQVLAGLSYLHARGLVHGDLKPSKIILLAEDEDELVKIVDLGIGVSLRSGEKSSAAQAWQAGSSRLCVSQDLLNCDKNRKLLDYNLLYASPEQLRGEKLDERSDIYSYGCIMYETLTGVAPLPQGNFAEAIHKRLLLQPEPFAVVREDLSLPERLEEIVFKSLEKEPSRR